MEMKIYHIADVHLGKTIHQCPCCEDEAGHKEKQFQRFENWMAQMERDAMLMIAGDLFEGRLLSYEDFRRLENILNQSPAQKVFIACGNHDPYGYYDEMNLDEKIFLFSPFEMDTYVDEVHKLWIGGQSFFKERESTPYDFSPLSYRAGFRHILVLHGELSDAQSEYKWIEERALPSFLDYVALGHIHKGFEKGKLIYPGALFPQSFKDAMPNGYVVIDMDSEHLTWRREEATKAQFFLLSMAFQGDVTQQVDSIQKQIPKAFWEEGYVRLWMKDGADEKQKSALKENLSFIFHLQILWPNQGFTLSYQDPFCEKLCHHLSQNRLSYGISERDAQEIERYFYEIGRRS